MSLLNLAHSSQKEKEKKKKKRRKEEVRGSENGGKGASENMPASDSQIHSPRPPILIPATIKFSKMPQQKTEVPSWSNPDEHDTRRDAPGRR